MSSPNGAPIYERQPDESESAYLAFLAYRDGPRPRISLPRGPGWSVAQARFWRDHYIWDLRCEEWDGHLARIEREALKGAIEKTAEQKGREWGKTLAKARAMVDRELSKLDAISATQEFPLPGVSIAQLTRLLEVTLKSERLIDSLPTEITEGRYDFEKLPLEERKALRDMLRRASVSDDESQTKH